MEKQEMERVFIDDHGNTINIKVSLRKSFEWGAYEPKSGECFVYIWPEGESIMENMRNRRSRPFGYYKKEILPEINRVLKESGMRIENFRWRQRLGCSCPCSPGFKTDVVRNDDRSFPSRYVMHVTIS